MLRGLVEQIVVRDRWLFVVAGDGGLFVFDAADPAAPRDASHLPALRSSLDIVFLADMAYVAEGNFVFDGCGSSCARDASHLPALRSSLDIVFLADMVYVAEGNAGVRVLDVSTRWPSARSVSWTSVNRPWPATWPSGGSMWPRPPPVS